MKKNSGILKVAAIVALCFAQGICAQKVWDGKIDTEWYWDNASQAEFTITTAEQLAGLAQLVNGGNNFSGKTIKLGANIVLNDTANWRIWGQYWEIGNRTLAGWGGGPRYDTTKPANIWIPIGSYGDKDENNKRPFSGTFDGGNYIVSGVYASSSNSYQGLFGYATSSVTIKNLGVTASFINYGGGLVGKNEGTITNCYATGNVSGSISGGLVGKNEGTITDCYTTGNVEVRRVNSYDNSIYAGGGLVGYNSGVITNCYATGNVKDRGDVGGLVGYNSGSITNCYATGNVKGDSGGVGGLVGENKGSIMNCYATGNVSGGGGYYVNHNGGLVGSNYGGTITNCYATGNVRGSTSGGLAGYNIGTITDCYAIGNVSGGTVGGLVGSNENYEEYNKPKIKGTITNCYATGNVKSGSISGGLAGYNSGTITDCYATGNVNGSTSGGLVGENKGAITNCYAMGNVSGTVSKPSENNIGGLVGSNVGGVITSCYATGDVNGGTAGGLVGSNKNYEESYREPEIKGTITNCYAMGNVNGSTVGGLMGRNEGTITNCYAIGKVSGLGTSVGGLVGVVDDVSSPKTTNSYYDRQASGQSDIVKGKPKSTAEMKLESTFEGWDFNKIWMIDADKNNGYPHLQSSKNLAETVKYKYPHKVQEGKVLADKRDNKKYKTVIIGKQTWMAENLNYNAKGSKCYENKPANCVKYGKLYDWATALKSCPSGWHLPTLAEWHELYNYVDDLEDVSSNLQATDKFGFSALFGGGGYEGGSFGGVGNYGRWWSAGEYSSNYAYIWYIGGDSKYELKYYFVKSYLFSVRCLQDEGEASR